VLNLTAVGSIPKGLENLPRGGSTVRELWAKLFSRGHLLELKLDYKCNLVTKKKKKKTF
jgi:hypothetical protein